MSQLYNTSRDELLTQDPFDHSSRSLKTSSVSNQPAPDRSINSVDNPSQQLQLDLSTSISQVKSQSDINTAVSWSKVLCERVLSKYRIVDVDFIPFTSSNRENTKQPHYPAEKGDLQHLLQQHNLKHQSLPLTQECFQNNSVASNAEPTISIPNENQSPFKCSLLSQKAPPKPSRRLTTRHSNSFVEITPLPSIVPLQF